MMKIVVTGALGHIGSYIIRDLPKQFPGSEIVLIDNLLTQRYSALFNLPKDGNYTFIEGDVTLLDLKSLFKNVYVVIHLAAITDAAGSFERSKEVEANNFQSTIKVAEACLENGARLISPSSTSVYGTQKDVVDEDCSEEDLQPQSPYAITKLKEENHITNLSHAEGLKAVLCRFGTIFGVSPGMRFHTAVNKFCWQASMGMPITVWTTAFDQKRPYLDLNDASKSIIYMIKNDIFDGEIYNVLSMNSTVREVVDAIKEILPSLQIEFVENKIMNQLSYEVMCEKFKSKGFTFSGDLKEGVKDTISILKS